MNSALPRSTRPNEQPATAGCERSASGPSGCVGCSRQSSSAASTTRRRSARPADELPAGEEEYRRWAEGRGPHLAGEVPVLRTRRGEWTFRATFSPTATAYRLGLTRDWVVIRFSNGTDSGERIVVTETRNYLRGQRVVRGRERECQACWAS